MYVANFSSGNAVISGGYINNLANLTATTTQTTNLSTGNAVITGGYVNGLANLTATTTQTTNFSTANAVITGGYVNNLTNLTATTTQTTNLSTGNAVITGGYVNGLANLTATTAQFTNVSTANAVISGGYISALTNATITTGNAGSWYAATVNATNANITTLAATNLSTGNAVVTGGYADNFAIGANTAGPASFTTANVTANLSVSGNAIVTNSLYAGNIITTGTNGNITGVDYLLVSNIKASGTITATGNVTAPWFLGNVKGATGNLTTVTANLVAASYVKSDNYQYANGEPFISTTIANTAEITANINGGQNIGLSLTATGVSAGNYGSASSIPTIVVDAKGRVTSITTNAASTGFGLAANTGTGSLGAGQILTIYGTAGEVETSVSGNAFTIGLPNSVTIPTLNATDFSTGNARITGGYADNFPVGANTAAPGAFTTLTAGNATITNTTEAVDSATGALVVTGGVGIGGNVYMHKNLTVEGNLIVKGNTTTISTQDLTVQDSIINLHTFANLAALTANDGRDIGIAFHYYKNYDDHAFLGLVNDSNLLEWYDSGSETTGNVFTGNTYGGFKTGTIIVANTTQATAANTGVFQVYGGGSILGNLYVGNIFASGGDIGTMSNVISRFVSAGSLTAGNIDATNIIATNVWIASGNINNLSNIDATTAQFTNLSTGNAVITGGYINNLANLNATTAEFTNLSSGNAWITGGYADNFIIGANTAAAGSFTTANTSANLSVGGDATVSGNTTVTGTVYAANIITPGGSGNISGVNYLLTSNIIATGLIIGNIQSKFANVENLLITNFSSGNAVITGGYINSVANVYATDAQFTNVSSGNAVITGGYVNNLTNLTATTTQTTNLSTGNAVITGGYITTLANIDASQAQFTNFSTGNAVISGGYISALTNAYITTAEVTNFSTGNAWISGGNINGLSNISATTAQFTNLSSANAVVTGGSLNNVIIGNTTPASGKFTTLNVTANVLLSPQDTPGTVVINPINIGSIDNMNLGASYQGNAYVTNFKTTQSVNIPATQTVWIRAGQAGIGSAINNIKIGNFDPATGVFTDLTGTTLQVNTVANIGTTVTTNFSTGNAVISGGYISALSNATITTGNVGSWYAATLNATAANITTLQVSNFSSANAVISGGYIYGIANLATTGTIVSNGNIVAAATTSTVNVDTGALVVKGGAGIAGNIIAGGNIVLGNTTTDYTAVPATANSAGAIITTGTGGAAIGGNIYVGQGAVINGSSSTHDTIIRGVTERSLIYVKADSVYDQVTIGGNLVSSNVTQGAKLTINSTDSMILPIGASGDRPGSSGYSDVEGMFRYNSTIKGVEFYDGTNWISPSVTITTITDTQYALASGNPAGNVDGSNVNFTLPSVTTTNGCIVSINGVLQLPTSAYSVGGGGLTLTFTEAPALGDVIDVRILTTTSSVSQLTGPNGLNIINIDNGNIIFSTGTVGTGIVDQWHIDTAGDFIPQTSANIGNAGHRVDYLFASNIDISGGTLSGVSLGGGALDNTPIGGNVPSTGVFSTLISNTLQVNAAVNFGDGIYLDDSQGYSVLSGTTGKIDSFDKTVYRSGKYFVQLTKTDNTEYQAAEIIVVHNGTTPVIEVYGVTFTGSANLATFSANISGSSVNINATAYADVNVKAHPVLMKL